MFRTITAKFTGTCKRCRKPIQPGERIRYGGYGKTYHFTERCSELQQLTEPMDFDNTQPMSTRIEEPIITGVVVADSLAGRF
jgi:hypothetical protein